jgi:uroporphyrin-III C-methyltransferase/precorrin-2 dehydrogenase/sirohydrochlorin ferrochelatase
VTGHLRDGTVALNWQSLVQPQQTVVFYMGLHGIEVICGKLIEHGLPGTFPAALVEQGTTPQQRVFIDTIAGLPERVKKAQLRAPTLIIIGNVVTLHKDLAWFKGDA